MEQKNKEKAKKTCTVKVIKNKNAIYFLFLFSKINKIIQN